MDEAVIKLLSEEWIRAQPEARNLEPIYVQDYLPWYDIAHAEAEGAEALANLIGECTSTLWQRLSDEAGGRNILNPTVIVAKLPSANKPYSTTLTLLIYASVEKQLEDT